MMQKIFHIFICILYISCSSRWASLSFDWLMRIGKPFVNHRKLPKTFPSRIVKAVRRTPFEFFFVFFVIPGGIGETVCAAVAEETGITVRMLAVPRIPRSGPGNALLDLYGISAKHIIKTVKAL